jgi:hypothetical protein
MGDAHRDVVDHVGEDEHRRAVAAQQHEVLDVGVVELDVAANEVVHHHRALRHPEAQHPTRPGSETEIARVAVVAGRALAAFARSCTCSPVRSQ